MVVNEVAIKAKLERCRHATLKLKMHCWIILFNKKNIRIEKQNRKKQKLQRNSKFKAMRHPPPILNKAYIQK